MMAQPIQVALGLISYQRIFEYGQINTFFQMNLTLFLTSFFVWGLTATKFSLPFFFSEKIVDPWNFPPKFCLTLLKKWFPPKFLPFQNFGHRQILTPEHCLIPKKFNPPKILIPENLYSKVI